MKIGETLYIKDRKKWRLWLEKNHTKKKEIWLIYYKKHTGKPRIPYDDAVEEALCYGWIDSTVKRIDDVKYAQKYTPRNPKSIWSHLNIERAKKMIQMKKMRKVGVQLYEEAMKSGRKVTGPRTLKKKLPIPPDLKKALAKNKKALNNFENLAPSAKLAYVYWVDTAKKDDTRQRRIKKTVELIAQNKKYGEK